MDRGTVPLRPALRVATANNIRPNTLSAQAWGQKKSESKTATTEQGNRTEAVEMSSRDGLPTNHTSPISSPQRTSNLISSTFCEV